VALRIGHICRWWALGYFKLFEIERNVTLGECLTILPPFRQIDLVDKVRRSGSRRAHQRSHHV
jgi:hypothetical protein